MKFQKKFLLCAMIALVLSSFYSSVYAVPPQYQVIDIGTLGGDRAQATDINNNGLIVGYTSGGTISKAFTWQNGVITQLSTDGCKAYGVNDSGQIVGSRPLGFNSYNRAVLWSGGQRIDLPTALNHKDSYARRINNSGQIVGIHYATDFDNKGVFWSYLQYWDPNLIEIGGLRDTRPWDLDNNGRVVGEAFNISPIKIVAFTWADGVGNSIEGDRAQSMAHAINSLQQIAGSSTDDPGNTDQAFLYDNDIANPLGWLESGNSSTAYGINDASQIVGSSTISGGTNPRAYFWENGQLYNLNEYIAPYSGWILTHATDINNNGRIIGDGKIGTETRSFLLIPTTLLTGDLDGDGDVDGVDLANFADDYANANPIADLNNDSNIDAQDVALFASSYGQNN